MYSNETPNYNLPQFLGSDKMDLPADFNPAFNTIDRVMEENRITAQNALDGVNGASADAVAARVAATRAENAATAAAKSAADAADTAEEAKALAERLDTEIDTIQDAQTQQGTQLDELSNEYHVFVRSQTALNTSQDNINAELQTKTNRHDSEITSLDSRVTQNEESIAGLQSNAASDKTELLEKITTNENSIATLQNSVSEHTNSIATLTSVTTNIHHDLDVAETAINKNTADIKALQEGGSGGGSADITELRNDIEKWYGEAIPDSVPVTYKDLYPEVEKNHESIYKLYGGDIPDTVTSTNIALQNDINKLDSLLKKVYGSTTIPDNITATNIGLENKVDEFMSHDYMTFDRIIWDNPVMGTGKAVNGPVGLADNHVYMFSCKVPFVYNGVSLNAFITGIATGNSLYGSQYIALEEGVSYAISVTISLPSNIATGLTTLLVDAIPIYGGTPSNKPYLNGNITVLFIGNRR